MRFIDRAHFQSVGRALWQVAVVGACAWLVGQAVVAAAPRRDAAALDSRYGTSGFVSRPDFSAAVSTSDGGVAGGAHGFAVTRLDPMGRPSASFGVGGQSPQVGVDATPTAIAEADDGSIFLAGPGSGMLRVAHVSAAGALDPRFGVARVASPAASTAIGIVPTADGGAVLGTPLGIVRVGPDGQVDHGYGTDGVALAPADVRTTTIYEIVDARAGRVLVLAHLDEATKHERVEVRRVNADGSLDPSFARSGSLVLRGAQDAHAVVRPDGGVLIVSDGRRDERGARLGCGGCELIQELDGHGRLRATRAIDGSQDATPYAITQDRRDRTLVAQGYDGYAGSGNALGGGMVVRLDASLHRDQSFGRCGAGAPRTGQNFSTETLAVAPSGRILQAGGIYTGKYSGREGTVIAAQRGGQGAHSRDGRPTTDPEFSARPGDLRHGLVLIYTTAVETAVDVRLNDSLGRVVGHAHGHINPCSTGHLRIHFHRRPHDRKLLLHAMVHGRSGRARATVGAACIDRWGRIELTGFELLSQIYCPS